MKKHHLINSGGLINHTGVSEKMDALSCLFLFRSFFHVLLNDDQESSRRERGLQDVPSDTRRGIRRPARRGLTGVGEGEGAPFLFVSLLF